MANPIKRLRRNIGRYYTWSLVIYGEVEMNSFSTIIEEKIAYYR